MLTEQERLNIAFKELLFHEESMAKKYAHLSQKTTNQSYQQVYSMMEQGAHNHHYKLTQVMSKFGIVV